MSKSWYVVQTLTNYERRVEKELKDMLAKARSFPESAEIDSSVLLEVRVPERDVESRDKEGKLKLDKQGKPKMKKELVMPGYVLLQLDLPESGWKDTCTRIISIRGITGFVGTERNDRPRPISDAEVKRIFVNAGEMRSDRITSSVNVGDQVKITGGAFNNWNGQVLEIYEDKRKVAVGVDVFGRVSKVECDFEQVEKV